MRRGTLSLLFFIILLAVGASYVLFWPNAGSGKPLYGINNPFVFKEGLDLQGGISVLLIPKSTNPMPTDDAMQQTRNNIEKRVNGGLGVNEPIIRTQNNGGVPGIFVELPGYNGDQQAAINTLLKTGVLEFWDTGQQGLQNDTPFDPTAYTASNGGTTPLFKGTDLDISSLGVVQDQQTGEYQVSFKMQGDAFNKLSTYTANHVGNYLTITLDRSVITSATIRSQLPGSGVITGNFTSQSAQDLVNLLKYGALPVALKTESMTTVGPTLGAESIHKSLIAGAIGIGIVVLFMLLYYRLPGFLADIALLLYTGFTLAVFKMLGVTMTLAGIAGFILSIGMAVDANVLIFERVKEELRAGRLLSSAIDIGWKRAWPSIRDSNISTMITCAVLYGFGTNFGATIIVGFATTLLLGVVISMFTAIVVTRTLLNLLVPTGVINHPALFGLPAGSIASVSPARRNSTV
jgi:preprotein translocase subunit SecD